MKAPTPRQFQELRERMGLTRRELGEWLDYSAANVQAWETGRRTPAVHAWELMLIEAGEHPRYCLRPEFDEPEAQVAAPATTSARLVHELDAMLAPYRRGAS